MGGPIWLLQLWFKFEPYLKSEVPPILEMGVEGLQLSQLTSDDYKVVSKEVFETYFDMFYRCKAFVSTMEPFDI